MASICCNKNIYDESIFFVGKYYRNYNEYLKLRNCRVNSVLSEIGQPVILGKERCCPNQVSNYYNNYNDFLENKVCCKNLLLCKNIK